MRTRFIPHPLFVCCFLLALMGAGLATVMAIDTSDCGTSFSAHSSCAGNTQATEQAANTIAIVSLVVVLGGIGFQMGRSPAPVMPPPVPFPVAGGPPRPGGFTPPPPPRG